MQKKTTQNNKKRFSWNVYACDTLEREKLE